MLEAAQPQVGGVNINKGTSVINNGGTNVININDGTGTSNVPSHATRHAGAASITSVAGLLEESGAVLADLLEYPREDFMQLCTDLNIDVVQRNIIWTERGTVKQLQMALGADADHVSDKGICALAVEGSWECVI
jgi:hypothetical protein